MTADGERWVVGCSRRQKRELSRPSFGFVCQLLANSGLGELCSEVYLR
jgi:hypothetical protein